MARNRTCLPNRICSTFTINAGTYMCELELVTPQGISIIAFTKITVKPRQDQDSVRGGPGQPESSPRAS